MELEIKLKQLLKERNMNQKELALKSGLNERTISEFATNKVERINKKALCKIAETLEIEDIREIIDFKCDSK